MTSRERVLAALNHQPPDRVPIDFSGHRSSGIMGIAYARLRDFLGLPKRPIRIYDPIQQLAIVDEDVLARFRVDTIELGRAFAHEDKYWTEWTLPDGTPCLMPAWAKPHRAAGEWQLRSNTGRVLARMPDGVLYFEQAYYPLMDDGDLARLPEAFAESMWTTFGSPPGPIVAGAEGQRRLAQGARELRARTDRAVIALFGGNLFEMGQFFYRADNFLMLLGGEPRRAHEFLEQVTEIHLANLDRFLDAVDNHVDVILFGDDFGMQRGPFISEAMYREFFQPHERVMWQQVKQRTRAKIMLHCCGGVRPLLDGMIAAGLDTINPVQIACKGMEAAGLKRDFGARLCLWGGGCDTQSVLPGETREQIGEHVRRQVATLAPGGGFVFQQVHNIMANVPPENIVAMFDAVAGVPAA